MTSRPTIIILLGAYWPGHESTGPNLSILAMCESLSNRFDFKIVARDRPFSGGKAVGVVGQWHLTDYASLRYLQVGPLGALGLTNLLRSTQHDLLVMNGFFDREFTLPCLISRRLGVLPEVATLLSPRGELTGGALSLKSGRKAFYRNWANRLDLHKGVHLHATSEFELADCQSALPANNCWLAPNFRSLFPLPMRVARPEGAPLRLMFLGRITEVKRLDFALRAIAASRVRVCLSIYGPLSDESYWRRCSAVIAELPGDSTAELHGEISNADVPNVLAAHDALLLPSLSENFGHAIFESLASGTPVIIGDRTPWRGLQSMRAGFDLPVDDLEAFASAIRQLAALSEDALQEWRRGARAKVTTYLRDSQAQETMVALFERLIAQRLAPVNNHTR